METISSSYAGGIFARFLIPVTVLTPIILGYGRLVLSWNYKMTPELGVSILVSSIVVVFLLVVIIMAAQINEKDKQRMEAEEKIQRLNIELQKTVEEKTAQLTNVFEGIPDGFIALDSQFNYIYANKRIQEMTGLDVKSVIGKNVWQLFPDAVGSDTYKAFVHARDSHQYVRNIDYYEPLDLWQENHIYPSIDGLFVFVTDISERKRAEKHQALLVSIIESSDEAIISKTTSGVITSWNKGAEILFGYTAAEAVGMPITNLIPVERYVEEESILAKICVGEYVNHFETVRVRKDGSYVDVSITVSPIKDSEEKIIGASKLARDITERKRHENEIENLNHELRKSWQRFKALIENSDDIITLFDENYNVIYRSANYERITGWKIDDEADENPISYIHENDRNKVIRVLKMVKLNPEKTFYIKYRFRHKDGHYLWMDGSAKNLLNSPDINAIVTNFRDITEKLEIEEKVARSEKIYRTIASSIPGSVISIINKEHRFTLAEGDLLKVLGYNKKNIVGAKISEVVPPERLAKILPDLMRVFQGEAFSNEITRSGFDLVTRYVPLRDDNEVYAAMIVSIDVTELKNAQRAIADLNVGLERKVAERTSQLAAVNTELEAFSYSVSHDLRAPLRAINGYSKILEEDYKQLLDDNGLRVLNIIKANGIRMSLLIDDLLTFSRLGRKDVQKFMVNMNELMASVLTEINRNSIHHADIVVHQLHDALADATLVKQVFINFISNAIKYSSKRDKPRIEVRSFVQDDEFVYSVQDNGAGFDMSYVTKLFGVFQRLHTADEFEGNGVGLATVKRIINKHGGRVWAEGKPGEGATFYFSLPHQNLKENQTLAYKYNGIN